jgi:TIR domain-containing protein
LPQDPREIDEAIRLHDRLLLILSGHSMSSEWVNTEIAKARKREVKEGKRVLFPVRLVGFEALRDWECFDADRQGLSPRGARVLHSRFQPLERPRLVSDGVSAAGQRSESRGRQVTA